MKHKILNVIKNTFYVALTLYGALLMINFVYCIIGELPWNRFFYL